MSSRSRSFGNNRIAIPRYTLMHLYSTSSWLCMSKRADHQQPGPVCLPYLHFTLCVCFQIFVLYLRELVHVGTAWTSLHSRIAYCRTIHHTMWHVRDGHSLEFGCRITAFLSFTCLRIKPQSAFAFHILSCRSSFTLAVSLLHERDTCAT